jgi:hypothetical protein
MRSLPLVLLVLGCSTSHSAPPPDAGPADAPADAGAGPSWRAVSPPQACLEGRPELVSTDLGLLAIRCEGEPLQLYEPGRERWERTTSVEARPIPSPSVPPLPGGEHPWLVGVLPDGTAITVHGSLHAVAPFPTWMLPPGGSTWIATVDAPWMNVVGAAPLSDDELLFAGYDAFVFAR